ncbi:MAG: exodeoxyribonuclease VII large subunit [Candidatus Dormibacteria bacterium]
MQVLTVSDLNDYLTEVITQEVGLQDLWVEGEVADLRPAPSGHCYFALKDARSRVNCVMFRREYSAVRFQLQHGMVLLAHGRLSTYRERGSVQLVLDRVQPSGVGDLHLAFEQLRTRLAAEGLFDETKRRKPPFFPRRLAVVTSASGAALRDVLKVLGRRCPATEVLVVHAMVQGEGAALQMVRALRQAGAQPGVEVVLLVRGGGSPEDLASFNDESLARAIRACPWPVIVGVGHETDTTIADFAADLRAPTPSAAAEMAVPDLRQLRQTVAAARQRLERAARSELGVKRERLEVARERLERQSPARQLPLLRQRLDDRVDRLGQALRVGLDRTARQLESQRNRLEALSPLRVLARGYSMARDEEGRVVTSITTLGLGSKLSTVFADGVAVGEVVALEPAAPGPRVD